MPLRCMQMQAHTGAAAAITVLGLEPFTASCVEQRYLASRFSPVALLGTLLWPPRARRHLHSSAPHQPMCARCAASARLSSAQAARRTLDVHVTAGVKAPTRLNWDGDLDYCCSPDLPVPRMCPTPAHMLGAHP